MHARSPVIVLDSLKPTKSSATQLAGSHIEIYLVQVFSYILFTLSEASPSILLNVPVTKLIDRGAILHHTAVSSLVVLFALID